MKNIAFTVNLGDYDHLPVPVSSGGWYTVLFTDSDKPQKRGWNQIIHLPKTDRPDLQAKEIKWTIHKHFPQSELYLYHDSSITVNGNRIPKEPFRVSHPRRGSVKQEALALIANNNRWDEESILIHYNYLLSEGFTDTNGLYLNGFFCRENNEAENKIGEELFDQISTFTSRDQLVLPYLLQKYSHKPPKVLPWPLIAQSIRLTNHAKTLKEPIYTIPNKEEYKHLIQPIINTSTIPKIFYITPARSDKNFGKAINDHIELLPEDAWIVLRDADTTFLTPDYVKQIEDIVNNYGHEYDLIGCYTNRIGLKYQLLNGELSEDVNIKNHIKIAKEQFEKYGSKTVPLHKNIAGFFMLFSKKAWNEHKFDEGLFITKSEGGRAVSGYIDYWFSNYFAKKKRVGIAKGLYVFHVYRLFHENRQVQTHLR